MGDGKGRQKSTVAGSHPTSLSIIVTVSDFIRCIRFIPTEIMEYMAYIFISTEYRMPNELTPRVCAVQYLVVLLMNSSSNLHHRDYQVTQLDLLLVVFVL